jgi:hypothetical protein
VRVLPGADRDDCGRRRFATAKIPVARAIVRVSGGKFMSANRRLESFRGDLLTSNRIVSGQYYRAQEGLVIIISARGV